MSLLDELEARGLFANCTDRAGLAELLAKNAPVSVYAGYDPTSSSLHVGNLVPTIMLKRLQLAGHRPIIVVGGATGMIGDPSGKSDERNLLDDATLARNLAGIRAQLSRLLDFERRDDRRADDEQRRLDARRQLPRVPARRRQAPDRQLHDGEGLGEEPPRGRRAASATPSSRTCCCRRSTSCSSRRRTAAACRSAATISTATSPRAASCRARWAAPQLFGLTAPLLLDSTRPEDGQDRRPASASGSIAERTLAVRVLPVLVQRQRRGRAALPQAVLAAAARRDRRAARARTTRIAPSASAQRELARAMTSWVHGERAVARVEAANRVMSRRHARRPHRRRRSTRSRRRSRRSTSRAPSSTAGIGIVDLLARTVAESKGAARRSSTRAART